MTFLAPLQITDASGSEVRPTRYDRLPGLPCLALLPDQPLRLASQVFAEARFLVTDVVHTGKQLGQLSLHFYAGDEELPRLRFLLTPLPQLPTRLAFDFKYLDAQHAWLPRSPGLLRGSCQGQAIALAEISAIELIAGSSGGQRPIFLAVPRLSTQQPFCPLKKQLLVDPLGQLHQREWATRTADTEAVVASLKHEAAQAAKGLPKSWSHYGGDRGQQHQATRVFCTHHDGRRWWLLDPDGYAFFSLGLGAVEPTQAAAVVPGTEELFEWIPRRSDPQFGDCRTDHPSWSMPTMGFGAANLRRAFGDAWVERWLTLTANRLQRWRFNTIGSHSHGELTGDRQFPYVLSLRNFPQTRARLYRDLPDVFAPEYAAAAKSFAAQLQPRVNDPYLLGYYLCEHPQWAMEQVNLASEMLENAPGSHSRRAFTRYLAGKYLDDAEACARVWGYPLNGFNTLIDEILPRLYQRCAGARADLDEFSVMLASRCTELPSKELKNIDPRHLNLGVRFAFFHSEYCLAAAAHSDVFSFDCTGLEPPLARLERLPPSVDKPVLLSGFAIGALDAGLLATGPAAVDGQVERGIAYRRFVELAAAHPAIIGCHYLALADQPGLGRYDGAACGHGFVDVCHRSYQELAHAATMTNERIYKIATGELPPFGQRAQTVPPVLC